MTRGYVEEVEKDITCRDNEGMKEKLIEVKMNEAW